MSTPRAANDRPQAAGALPPSASGPKHANPPAPGPGTQTQKGSELGERGRVRAGGHRRRTPAKPGRRPGRTSTAPGTAPGEQPPRPAHCPGERGAPTPPEQVGAATGTPPGNPNPLRRAGQDGTRRHGTGRPPRHRSDRPRAVPLRASAPQPLPSPGTRPQPARRDLRPAGRRRVPPPVPPGRHSRSRSETARPTGSPAQPAYTTHHSARPPAS